MAETVVAGPTIISIGAGDLAERVLGAATLDRVALLVQPGVPAAIGRRLAADLASAEVFEVPDGEAAKTLGVAEDVCRRFEAAGIGRSGLIVGVGGGALTDLAGFVAGIYLRGVRLRLVPTTLVAALDAAIGGKSGVNLAAKNQVGLFRQPDRVVIDTAVLAELPVPLLREGAAEALKAGLIGDPALVALYERRGLEAPLEEVVARAVAVKSAIVARDFAEQGERAHLNYGHTVGHAVEVAAGIPHGEAVAVGMVAAGRASALVAGFDAEERQRAVIARLGLPVVAPQVDAAKVRSLMGSDKKRQGDALRMVLLAAIGSPRVVAVDDATVTAALHSVGIEG